MTRDEFKALKKGDKVILDPPKHTQSLIESTIYEVSAITDTIWWGLKIAFKNPLTNLIMTKSEEDHDQITLAENKANPENCMWHMYEKYVGFTEIYDYCIKCGHKGSLFRY